MEPPARPYTDGRWVPPFQPGELRIYIVRDATKHSRVVGWLDNGEAITALTDIHFSGRPFMNMKRTLTLGDVTRIDLATSTPEHLVMESNRWQIQHDPAASWAAEVVRVDGLPREQVKISVRHMMVHLIRLLPWHGPDGGLPLPVDVQRVA